MNLALLGAGIASLITMLIHLTAGGRYLARPLLDSGLHPVVKYTHYFCWHMVTITITAMAAMFAAAAFSAELRALALFATALALLFCLLNFSLVLITRQRPLHMPQWLLFLIISILGITGLLQPRTY